MGRAITVFSEKIHDECVVCTLEHWESTIGEVEVQLVGAQEVAYRHDPARFDIVDGNLRGFKKIDGGTGLHLTPLKFRYHHVAGRTCLTHVAD